MSVSDGALIHMAKEIARLRAQVEEGNGLLNRAKHHLMEWQGKYGEHNTQWLPPAHGVRLIEDIDAAIAKGKLWTPTIKNLSAPSLQADTCTGTIGLIFNSLPGCGKRDASIACNGNSRKN